MKTKNKILITVTCIGLIIFSNSCSSIPKKAEAVDHFEMNQYLGIWYEIARLDFRFEKNLDNVSAHYSFDEKGNVVVSNSGYNKEKQTWKRAIGVAKFRKDEQIGKLKVSFFGPFYAGYNVIALDEDYQYALVAGKNLNYLWILSRKKSIPDKIKANFLKIASEIGYDTSDLIWVQHDRNDNPFLNEK
ncbi:lipocalin family protein [Empedobacter brevis]|uniref:lipocalin family protein n=1 Tax=Empedobacter brevis TaxID=247 RepID=UPI0028A948E3|nr:lipocalin family protein [Empedobacter brevis]